MNDKRKEMKRARSESAKENVEKYVGQRAYMYQPRSERKSSKHTSKTEM